MNIRTRRGFTLVELLVVIAVILILAGLIVPAAMRSMVHARSTACVNNLRQTHSGLTMYVTQFGFFAAFFGAAGIGINIASAAVQQPVIGAGCPGVDIILFCKDALHAAQSKIARNSCTSRPAADNQDLCF